MTKQLINGLEVDIGPQADLHRANLGGANLVGANLHGANLHGANLHGAELLGADLGGANLYGADLGGANLHDADLVGANLHDADLVGANLHGANLHGANLYGADLLGADLGGANLYGANLGGANLYGANLGGANLPPMSILPEGDIIGWKKCANGVIVKLLIPSYAMRSNATGRKCRADRATVLEVIGAEVGISLHSPDFEYRVAEVVTPVEPFDEDWRVECGSGIHFYITRAEAEAN
jgi:hypothetical protein